jgi:galactose oxidase
MAASTTAGTQAIPTNSVSNSPATLGGPSPAQVGSWGPVFPLPNVAVHAHILPNGKVLFWGRRDQPNGTMDEHECTPQIWDPETQQATATPQPMLPDGTRVNLFCSGHAFLPDGRLLVAGGHLQDSHGVNQAFIFDWRTTVWQALPAMTNGRWYPTVTTLTDGSILVASGSYFDGTQVVNNSVPEIWEGQSWRSLEGKVLPLYPRMHVLPDRTVLVAGSDADSVILDTSGTGRWLAAPDRMNGDRQYAPSVTYAAGKVVYIGGGNDSGSNAPTAAAEVIDFNTAAPRWTPTAPMHHRRRQHNATILADGTILVTGGTRGGGGPDNGFNDLSDGQPVHEAELWDPMTGNWTMLAAEDIDRCYHATAILLPDATVLSAGGGEYTPGGQPIPPQHVHRDGQIFSPPYLFRGTGGRPEIETELDEVDFGSTFTIRVSGPPIAKVNAIRLGSVTHAFNFDQYFCPLEFREAGDGLVISTPADASLCPPGHYMLFAISSEGVPSRARIVRIGAAAVAHAKLGLEAAQATSESPAHYKGQLQERDRAIKSESTGTRVTIGLTSKCPYGLAACWSGAYQTLKKLDGVDAVRPIADSENSTADVYLEHNGLPNLERWPAQISERANASYDFRGIEVTLIGTLGEQRGRPQLALQSTGVAVELRPLAETQMVQWNLKRRAPSEPTTNELAAFGQLQEVLRAAAGQAERVCVTGPLRREGGEWRLHVRKFATGEATP